MTAQLIHFASPKKQPKPNGYTDEFESFWQAYPRKLNCSKLMAFKAWQKIPPDDRIQIILCLPIFVRLCVGKDEQFIPHPATWLNQRRWETVQPPTISAISTAGSRELAERIFRATGKGWRPEYGPEPE